MVVGFHLIRPAMMQTDSGESLNDENTRLLTKSIVTSAIRNVVIPVRSTAVVDIDETKPSILDRVSRSAEPLIGR